MASWLDEAKPVDAPAPSWLADATPVEDAPDETPPPPKVPEKRGIGETVLSGIGRGAWSIPGLVGLDHAKAQAIYEYVKRKASGEPADLASLEAAQREGERAREKDRPIVTGLSIGAGAIPSMLVMPQSAPAAGAGLAARSIAGGTTAAAQAAATEAGVTADLPWTERLKRMGIAAGFAAPIGALAPGAPTGLTQKAIDAVATPKLPRGVTPEAARLLDEGVPLTPGQRNPTGLWSQLEEASTSLPVVGPKITEARQAAREAWADVALNRGRAPGAEKVGPGSLPEKVDTLYQGFRPAYAEVKGALAPTDVDALGAALQAATANESHLVTDVGRESVQRFLGNQFSLLTREGPTLEKLLAVRSNIRDALRQKARTGDEVIPLLKDAESAVTQAIVKGAPPEVAEKLAATDQQYALYKTLEDAARRAGDQPAGLSPTHLQNAIKGSTAPGAYSRGAGGELRDLARAGKETFDVRVPMTGARMVTMIPGLRYGIGAAAYVRAARSASTAEALSKALHANPQAFGPHAQQLLTMEAQRGPEGLAAAHYVLSQTSPDYRARWQAAAAEPGDEERGQ